MKKTILLFLFIFSSFSFAQNNSWLSLAIVRTDGIIVPTYRYQNAEWKNICGRMNEFRFYESTLRKWFFYPFDSQPSILNVGSLVHFDPDSDISNGYGYISNYHRKNLTTNIFPVSKAGVCLNKEYPISIFKSVVDSTKYWNDIFNIVAKQKIEIDTNYWKKEKWDFHFGKEHIVNFNSIVLKSIIIGSSKVFYYEANHYFGEADCKSIIFINGWVVHTGNQYKVIDEFIGFDDCDFKLLSSQPVTPLMAIEVDERIYLLNINHAYEGEDYKLWEITKFLSNSR